MNFKKSYDNSEPSKLVISTISKMYNQVSGKMHKMDNKDYTSEINEKVFDGKAFWSCCFFAERMDIFITQFANDADDENIQN